jgi:hypothetical protein
MKQEKGIEPISNKPKKVSAEIAVRKADKYQNFSNAFLSLFLSFVGGLGFVVGLSSYIFHL